MVITNTWFKKRDTHLITYYSASKATQIDYVLVRRRNLSDVLDAKIIPYEGVVTQHRPVICKLGIKTPRTDCLIRNETKRIKWWKFKEKEANIIAKNKIPPIASVEKTWNRLKDATHKAAHAVLRSTKPGRQIAYKDAWL